MTARNDITGDKLVTKSPTDSYRDGWSRIFGSTPGQKLYEASAQALSWKELSEQERARWEQQAEGT